MPKDFYSGSELLPTLFAIASFSFGCRECWQFLHIDDMGQYHVPLGTMCCLFHVNYVGFAGAHSIAGVDDMLGYRGSFTAPAEL